MVYSGGPLPPLADPQRSSVHINIIKTRTAINDIITPDEYQALLWDPQWVCSGFLAQVNTVNTEILHAFTALDISNIRPLGSAGCVTYI